MHPPFGKSALPATLRRTEHTFSERRQQLLESKCYRDYIYTADSEERLSAFLAVESCLGDGDYWSLLRDVYSDAELVMPDLEVWLRLFRANRAGRGNLMNDGERAFLARLADPVEIYRGCGTGEGIFGMAWTLSRDQAVWFARYACGARRRYHAPQFAGISPLVVTGECNKRDLLAHFCEREEAEIVVDPDAVEITAIVSVEADPIFDGEIEMNSGAKRSFASNPAGRESARQRPRRERLPR